MTTRVYQEKNGRTWETKHTDTDATSVYEWLSNELIAKKLNGCTWIKSIKRVNLYDGNQKITVTYDHGGRSVYTVKN